jgi:hypothetical protein
MLKKPDFRVLAFVIVISLTLTSISCGVSGLPFFATATPTPTTTFTPSPTLTPSSTPTLTPTLTPTRTFTPTPVPEASVEQLADGSTRFTDVKGGYTFVLPAGWLVVNFAVDDPLQALEAAQDANPDKAQLLNGLRSAVAQNARMGAADFAPKHFTATSAPFLFTTLDETTASMPLKDFLEANRTLIPQLLKAQVTASELKESRSGVPYGILDITINLTANNQTASIRERLIMFKTDRYTVLLTFAALNELRAAALPGVVEMSDSIELLEP